MAQWKYKISVSKDEINNLIGINLSEEEIENI
jgi:phenylalanyl-tRNA synthetase beta subunit